MTTGASRKFQWNVVLLDDGGQTALTSSTDALLKAGFCSAILSTPEEIKSGYVLLKNADLVLCDMKWDNFNAGGGTATAVLPSSVNNQESLSQWVDTITEWVGSVTTRVDAWPQHGIRSDDVGLWLAA